MKKSVLALGVLVVMVSLQSARADELSNCVETLMEREQAGQLTSLDFKVAYDYMSTGSVPAEDSAFYPQERLSIAYGLVSSMAMIVTTPGPDLNVTPPPFQPGDFLAARNPANPTGWVGIITQYDPSRLRVNLDVFTEVKGSRSNLNSFMLSADPDGSSSRYFRPYFYGMRLVNTTVCQQQ
ncbi:MAG: hypothetical protein ACXWP5_13000 [Bdellovibrionota bacterium]